MLGLERGTVMLFPHEKEWELEAQRTIAKLKSILGSVAKDIQHVALCVVVNLGYVVLILHIRLWAMKIVHYVKRFVLLKSR